MKTTYLTRDTAQHYDEDMMWKLDVGAECNRLLDFANGMDRSSAANQQLCDDISSIVTRVAEFEELETL